VLSDDRFWRNTEICKDDHAHFLWTLTKESKKVWFLIQGDAPSLTQIIWKRLPETILSLGLLIGLMIWRFAPRFGPLKIDTQETRRQLMEHIEASAAFYWQRGEVNELIDTLRNDIEERIERLRLDYSSKNFEEKTALIHKLTQVPEDSIQYALTPVEKLKEPDFIQQTQILQQIRKSL